MCAQKRFAQTQEVSWDCVNCRQPATALETVCLDSAADVFIARLQRMEHAPGTAPSSSKARVTFPREGLDLARHIAGGQARCWVATPRDRHPVWAPCLRRPPPPHTHRARWRLAPRPCVAPRGLYAV